MKNIVLVFLSLASFVLANDIVEMKPYNPVKNFDTLRPNIHKTKAIKISKGFSSQIKNINSVNTILEAEDGFYISGNSLTTDNIDLKFNAKAFTKSIDGVGYFSSSADKEIFSLSSKSIFVSLLHYSKDGEFLWRNDFANDMLSSTSMIRLQNGKLIVALTPVYVNKKEVFQSYIFIYSKSGKLLSKHKYKNYIINSMLAVSKNKILCGANKKVKGEFRKNALLIDDEGFKIKDIDLDSKTYIDTIYDDLTNVTKISSGYLLSGGQDLIKLDNKFKFVKDFYIGPTLDQYSSYFVNVVHEDKDDNIHIIGNYGHRPSAIQTMKLDRLKRLNSPRTIQEQMDPASRAMRKNTVMSMVYDEMIREERKSNQKRSHGYTGIYTKDNKFLTLIKKNDYAQEVDFYGVSDKGGLFYFEYYENETTTKQYLFNNNAELIMSSGYSELLCEIKCMLKDNNLFYISLDEKTASLKFNKIRFEIK